MNNCPTRTWKQGERAPNRSQVNVVEGDITNDGYKTDQEEDDVWDWEWEEPTKIQRTHVYFDDELAQAYPVGRPRKDRTTTTPYGCPEKKAEKPIIKKVEKMDIESKPELIPASESIAEENLCTE